MNSNLNILYFWQNLQKFALFAILTVFAVFEEAFKIWQFFAFACISGHFSKLLIISLITTERVFYSFVKAKRCRKVIKE